MNSASDYGYEDFIAEIDAVVIGRKTFDQVTKMAGWPYDGKRALTAWRSNRQPRLKPACCGSSTRSTRSTENQGVISRISSSSPVSCQRMRETGITP